MISINIWLTVGSNRRKGHTEVLGVGDGGKESRGENTRGKKCPGGKCPVTRTQNTRHLNPPVSL
jgi:hypothetical protein